jgi:hypothetical protein
MAPTLFLLLLLVCFAFVSIFSYHDRPLSLLMLHLSLHMAHQPWGHSQTLVQSWPCYTIGQCIQVLVLEPRDIGCLYSRWICTWGCMWAELQPLMDGEKCLVTLMLHTVLERYTCGQNPTCGISVLWALSSCKTRKLLSCQPILSAPWLSR